MRRTVSSFDHMKLYESTSLKKQNLSRQKSKSFRRSLSNFNIKKKSSLEEKSKKQRKPSSSIFQNAKKTIPEQIQAYINKRKDVEIVNYFEEYKHQFQIKAKVLNDYIDNAPEPDTIKNNYLNINDPHYKNGLQSLMLRLFRNGTIVPQSYTNLRDSAVQELQNWVLSWIHRKILYGKLAEDEDNQLTKVEEVLGQLQEYQLKTIKENTSF